MITTTSAFTYLLHENAIKCVTPTEELLFLMMAFLGKDCAFLDENIRSMLAWRCGMFFDQNKTTTFQLNETYEGEWRSGGWALANGSNIYNILLFAGSSKTFENMYIQFLDHFQSTSYCDPMFGAFVMIPLAQKYELRWRKIVWSEHLPVIRFIHCTEEQVIN